MLAITLRGLWSHKRRLAGTFLAVLLGVAFLAGTLVLGDTLRANFDTLFTSVTGDTGAVVRSATKVDSNPASPRGPIDASLVERVRAAPGAAEVQPVADGLGQIVGKDGKVLSTMGPPRASNWIADPSLTPYRIVEGRAPQADDEVVINKGAANDGELRIGDRTTIDTPAPVRVTVVGIVTFQGSYAFGGSSYTGFTLAGAERHLAGKPGQVNSILVKAAPGVSQQELVSQVRPLLPAGVEAITGQQLSDESISDINQGFLGLFRTFLTVFAGIALFVAMFSIANTFAIIVAQRTRESALLRAIGASRRQVLWSVVVEGLAVGLLAGVLPAVRASRVAPLAALRDVASEPPAGSRLRVLAGAVLAAGGVAATLVGVLGGGDATTTLTATGAVLLLSGVVVLGPAVARPASRLIGAPLGRLRGITGALARQNAMRNPRRTSGAAMALLIGVAVVTLFTVFTASIQASIRQTVAESFGGDLAITSGGFAAPRLATQVGKLPEVQRSVGVGNGRALVGGSSQEISVADPAALDGVVDLRMSAGSISGLRGRQFAVASSVADDRGWRLGQAVPVRFADGATETFTLGAIYDAQDAVVGSYLMPRDQWAPHAPGAADQTVLIALRPGTDLETGKAAVARVAAGYGRPDVRDRAQYTDSLTSVLDPGVSVVYVLLVLAIVIALMGIANTLSLSVHERTRELGLLRAVGETRRQVRAMVRWESVIVALFGTIGGLGLGVFLGWALVRASASGGTGTFAAPPLQLTIIVLVGAIAGVLAGLRPARRAAKLNLLAAIASE